MEYTVRKMRRSRSIRIRVRVDGTVSVTAPYRVSLRVIDAFVCEKAPWIAQTQATLAALPRRGAGDGTPEEYAAHKKAALALVTARLGHFQPMYGFRVGKVGIRNQRSRWGSCNRRGDLSFNYRIVFLPQPLQDYLVVHELCHIGAFNHSAQFWALVAKAIPNYRVLRRQANALHIL